MENQVAWITTRLTPTGCDVHYNNTQKIGQIIASDVDENFKLAKVNGYGCVLGSALVDYCNGQDGFSSLFSEIKPGDKTKSAYVSCLALSTCVAENVLQKKYFKHYVVEGSENSKLQRMEVQLNGMSAKSTLLWIGLAFMLMNEMI